MCRRPWWIDSRHLHIFFSSIGGAADFLEIARHSLLSAEADPCLSSDPRRLWAEAASIFTSFLHGFFGT